MAKSCTGLHVSVSEQMKCFRPAAECAPPHTGREGYPHLISIVIRSDTVLWLLSVPLGYARNA